jgi:protein O-mannosyl-transferase
MPTSQGMSSSEATHHNNLIPVLICLALAILTVIAFWPLKDCGFISMDDPVYVSENAHVQSGLNWDNLGKALSFSSELVEKSSNWHPLTWLSLMLDYQIFGLNPQGFHLVNLLFHVMNTLLLFLILRRMTKSLWPSAFVAALFAIHPLHVESIAWITERKDVLSTFFWMLTMGAYSYYVEHPGFRRYSLVLLFFVLGLMAKPMLVTLPFVLLLLDYWPLQRFEEIKPDRKVQTLKETLEVKKPAAPEYKRSLIYPLLWEKVPLFVLAILSSIITYIAQQKGGAIHSEEIPLVIRVGNAFISYIAYIGKMIWPSNLAFFYPHPLVLLIWHVFGSVLLMISITIAVFWLAKRSPYLATGWLWYIGTLVPIIGIVQVGGQAMADRYTYVPLIGLFIMVAWGFPSLIKNSEIKKILFPAGIVVLVIMVVLTWQQCGYWKNTITLYKHTLQVTNNNVMIHNDLGWNLCFEGKIEEAIDNYNKALQITPDNVTSYDRRGMAYATLGQYQRAIEDFNEAIRLQPKFAQAYNNRASVRIMQGNNSLCCSDAQKACELGICKALKIAKSRGYCN